MIQVSSDQELTFKLTGGDLKVLLEALDELQHKIAKPVELKLMQQVQAQLQEKDPF